MDPTVTSAKSYVETRYADWSTAFLEGYSPAAHAALAYMRTPGANATIVNQMKAALGNTVNNAFAARGPFRNSVADSYYHWGSNKVFGSWGALVLEAAAVGATGSHTAAECRELAQDWLHHFHGQNAMGMTYLTNMAAYGGEHSSFQFFHSWFGAIKDPDSVTLYRGLPTGLIEPDYPYFKGVDNYGVSDNNVSQYGPVPGMVVGGSNKDYSGRAKPPLGATYYERFYRDWIDDAPDGWYRTKVWEVNENSISYQGPYVALIAAFMTPWAGTADTIAPGAPSGLAGTAVSSSRIDLNWSDNTQSDLFGYNVYRGSAPGGPYQLIYGGTTTSALLRRRSGRIDDLLLRRDGGRHLGQREPPFRPSQRRHAERRRHDARPSDQPRRAEGPELRPLDRHLHQEQPARGGPERDCHRYGFGLRQPDRPERHADAVGRDGQRRKGPRHLCGRQLRIVLRDNRDTCDSGVRRLSEPGDLRGVVSR